MSYPRKWYPQPRRRRYPNYRRNTSQDMPIGDLNLDKVSIDKVPYTGGKDTTEYGWDPQQRPIKEISRHVVAKASKKNKKHLLVFPGSIGRDIELLRHYKVATPKSKWTLVEKDSKPQRLLKERGLFKNTRNVLDHEDHFNALRNKDISEKFGSLVKYDFAWFDLCGNLGLNDINWLKDSFPADFPNLDLFFTFGYASRGNRTTKIIRKTLWDWHRAEMLETRLSIRASKNLRRQQRGLPTAGYGYEVGAITRGDIMDQSIAAHWQLFKYIFNGHKFNMRGWVYNDQREGRRAEMLLYHLSDFKPSEDFEFAEKTHAIIDVYSKYNGNNTDAEISSYTEIPENKIKKWRVLNDLIYEKFSQYKLAIGFESLLISEELPATKSLAKLCCQRLKEFHDLPFKRDKIRCSTQKNKVQVISDKGKYTITIGKNVEYDPDRPTEVKIIPEFLTKLNKNALFSIFRNLFRSDEFLHPQLCNHGYENCFILSDPQKEAIASWISSYNLGEKTGAIVLPTGMGKTIVAAHIVNHLAEHKPDLKILFFTKYREILQGAIEKFKAHTRFNDESYYCRFYGAKKTKFDCLLTRPCVFATDASLVKLDKGKKSVKKTSPLLKIPSNHFDIVIADEAHHVNANRWSAVIDHFKMRKAPDYILGLTATPFRGDEQDPLIYFNENTISRKNLNRGIWEGYLSWPDYYLYEDRTDYREVLKLLKEGMKSKAKEKQVNIKLKNIHQKKCLSEDFQNIVLEKYLHHAAGKKTIGFAPNKLCAKSMAEFFTRNGVPASYLISPEKGDKPSEYWARRDQVYNDFVENKLHVLFSVGIFDEGVDIPDVEALIKFNRTSSPVKIIQQLGRGLRLFPGKSSVIVLDFVGNYQDLDAYINLGKMTGTNTRLLQRLQRKKSIVVDEDLSIIPPGNLHISEGAKFIVKNVVEDAAIVRLSPILERKVIDLCKKGYYWWRVQKRMENVIGVTREQAKQLCANITATVDEVLRDKLQRGILYKKIIGGGSYEAVALMLKNHVVREGIISPNANIDEHIKEYVDYVNKDNLVKFIQQCDSIDTAAGILGIDGNILEDLIAE